MDEQIFKIEGFHCEACVKLSTMRIKKLSDVHNVEISTDGLAKVCAGRIIAPEEIAQSLDGLGYSVKTV